MKLVYLAGGLLFIASCTERIQPLAYPKARKVDTVTNYFGTKVPDPYRWMENDTTAERAAWVKAENDLTESYLAKIPFRDVIKKRLGMLYNYAKCTLPFKRGNYYFFYKNSGTQNQSVLYVQDGATGTPRVLLDPNMLTSDGTTSISEIGVSNDHKYIAYGTSKAGSDWNEFYVIDIATGKQLSDELKWIKFSNIAWKGNGFYYTGYEPSSNGSALTQMNEHSKIYYHKVGNPQSADSVVFEDKQHPMRTMEASVTQDEKYLSITEEETTDGNSLIVKDLTKKGADFVTIVSDFTSDNNIVDDIGSSLLIFSNRLAPRYKLIMIDPEKPDSSSWKTILPEQEYLMQNVSLCNGKIVASYLKDVSTHFYSYDITGKQIGEIELPGLGTSDFSSTKEDSVAFYSFTNYTTPMTIYKYNQATNKSSIFFKPNSVFNSDDFETKQVFYNSKDGTKIPMFIVCKKGTTMDGKTPCFLYAYGGFNISILPTFSPSVALFLENGGIYAVPNIRGGGEYGEKWHEAGTKLNKQNVFDDFIAAAQYLIDNKYTSHDKLAIHGRSNGGLLIGAVMTERPDLAKVAIPTVGVMDMLRYQKFTIGWSWAGDYGTSDDSIQFHNLIKFSPLHNVKNVEYPATLVTTADHDDRVVPAHSLKFIATLQEHQKGSAPVLVRIDHNAGHGSGKPISKQIEEFGDVWTFVFYNLGMEPKS
ncbi:MAG TPA: prolyl oligopeptidase family serine peptidase [Bacteroidia bacterium]|jgi:prolyl oligopeptidase|nr:prolyl oligopeptidase family serine peptidase [Bacteroidia bacterium]